MVRTPSHVRLIQNGVCISSLRTTPGPSQSVSDILAVLVACFAADELVLLGFAAGGLIPPLAHLQVQPLIQAVDLDSDSYQLFHQSCPHWSAQIHFHHQDALEWIRQQKRRFPMIIDDLSIPTQGDVFKPEVSWNQLPMLIRQKLTPEGITLLNMLPNPDVPPTQALAPIAAQFPAALLITLKDYENHILVLGPSLPPARVLSAKLKLQLRRMKSLFANQVTVSSFSRKNKRDDRKDIPKGRGE